MADIIQLIVPKEESIDDKWTELKKDFPTAKQGILIVFDGDDNTMCTYYSCNYQQMSAAAVRLIYLADKIGEEE